MDKTSNPNTNNQQQRFKMPPPPPTLSQLPQSLPLEHIQQTKRSSSSIQQMVKQAFDENASDIHIRVGHVPRIRIRGQMVELQKQPETTPGIFEHYLSEILTPKQRQVFEDTKEMDTAIFYPGFIRCRVNCFESLTGGAMVLRLITLDIPSIDDLRLPQVFKKIIEHPQGLILVTGPTGSGKSTTMAAMIRHLNENASKHIVTIEDPIEFVHSSLQCLVSQREVGLHTLEFHSALRAVLREDPDVILIGEMRDPITVNTALQAAQTGHLVLGTLHTRNAINSINRLLNLFKIDEQPAVRLQVCDSLVAVIAQLLVPTVDNRRTAVHDVLVNTPAMQDYLLKGDEDSARRLMEEDTFEGMQVINDALYNLMLEGRVSMEEAEKASPDSADLDRRFRTGGLDAAGAVRNFKKSSIYS